MHPAPSDAPIDATFALPPFDLSRALLDATATMAWAVDREYRLLTSNIAFQAAMAVVIGRPPRTGESMLMARFPSTVLRHWKAHYDAAFDGQRGEYVSEMPTPTGPKLLELVTTPLRAPDGQIIGCAAVCRELSDGGAAERELLARRAFDLELFSRNPQPMWVFDDESLQFLAVNDAAMAQYGWSEREFLSMTILDIRPPSSIEALVHQVVSDHSPRPPNSGAWEHRRKDGTVLTVEVHSAPLSFRGRPARLATVHDITATREAVHRWQVRDRLLRDAIDAMPIGVLLLDRAGEVRWANHAARAIAGTGAVGDDLLQVHPADMDAVRQRRAAYLEGDLAMGEAHDVRFVHPDGRVVWATMRAVPLGDGTDTDGLHVVTVADRTAAVLALEADRATAERRQRQQQLESLGALAAGLSHEFRNLLAVVSGHVELLQMTTPDDPGFRVSLDELAQTTLRGRELLQSILAFSRGGSEGTVAWTSAAPQLRAALQLSVAGVGRADVTSELPDPAIETTLSGTQWIQVMVNLLQNAAEAVRSVEAPRIAIGSAIADFTDAVDLPTGRLEAGRYLCVTVRDNGAGIRPEHMGRLFEPFFTTRASSGGTGLGLSVVAGVVRRAHGALDVHSSPGVGTTILMYLPLQTTAPTAAAHGEVPSVLIVSTDLARKRRIEAIAQTLGWRVRVANGARAALAMARAAPHELDVVYLDYDLHGTTGVETAEALSTIRPELPVVLGSPGTAALALVEVARRGVSLLVDDGDPAAIVDAMQAALTRGR